MSDVHKNKIHLQLLPREMAAVRPMLSDGGNPEGSPLEPPLAWTTVDAVKEADIVLYNSKYSPPCAKIR